MALNINTNITNNLDGYLLDAKNVKGTYVVVARYSDLANLPNSCVVKGMLAYCQNDYSEHLEGFYQYNGSTWLEAQLGGMSELMTMTTYSQFVSTVENSQLIPGMKYRITDYVTKINGVYDLTSMGQAGMYLPYATSAEHQFDLIVTATGTRTYNENVKASRHSFNDYFEHSNVDAWELKWTHINDISNYSYVDVTNGKGIITWMKDEFGNEAWYDFKNIMFLNFKMEKIDGNSVLGSGFVYDEVAGNKMYSGTLFDVLSALQQNPSWDNLQLSAPTIGGASSIVILASMNDVSIAKLDTTFNWTYTLALLSALMGTTVTLATLAYLLGKSEETLSAMTEREIIQQILQGDFFYTFDIRDNNNVHYDLSIGYTNNDDFVSGGAYCSENKLEHCSDALSTYLEGLGTPGITSIPNGLNVIDFQSTVAIKSCVGNKIGVNSFLIVFGDGCIQNEIGTGYSIRIGNNSSYNTLPVGFNNDISGSSNRIGKNSYENYIGRSSDVTNTDGNIIDEQCHNNVIYTARNNYINSGCDTIILNDNCNYNIFNSECSEITIGALSQYNVLHCTTKSSINGSNNILIHCDSVNLSGWDNILKQIDSSNFTNNCSYNIIKDIRNKSFNGLSNYSNINKPFPIGTLSPSTSTAFTMSLANADNYFWFKITIYDGTYEYCQTFTHDALTTRGAILQISSGNYVEFSLSGTYLIVTPTGVTVNSITIYGES